MAVARNALTTLSRVKAKLNKTDTVNDDVIEMYIDEVSQYIIDVLDRDIILTEYTDESHDGTGSVNLYLDQYPIKSIESISIFDNVMDSDLYESNDKDKKIGRVYYPNLWPQNPKLFGDLTNTPYRENERTIKATYTAGYCTDKLIDLGECSDKDLPADLQGLVDNIVVLSYTRFCQGTIGIASYKVGGRDITYQDMLPDMQSRILNKYKRKEV